MSWNLHRAPRGTCGIQHHDQFQLFQHILHWWVLSWTQWQSVASSSFADFISSPTSPNKSRSEPRNWLETSDQL